MVNLGKDEIWMKFTSSVVNSAEVEIVHFKCHLLLYYNIRNRYYINMRKKSKNIYIKEYIYVYNIYNRFLRSTAN